MGKKLLFSLALLQASIILLLLNVSYLSALQKGSRLSLSFPKTDTLSQSTLSYREKPSTGRVLGSTVEGGDARSLLLKQFITRYQPTSPFMDYTDLIVSLADQYKIDFRLVPAIAMCESNMGKRLPKKDAYNAWGIAVFSSDIMGKRFNDWPHAFEWVSKYIKERYYDRGITDLYDIGAIWAPPSVENGYSWTRCVQGFMDKIQ